MKYRAEIDGLRGLAVVPVILFHAGIELFTGGFVGVDVFFVISGYLITTILLEDIENNCFSIVNFYERRARRILPALYLVIFSTAIASLIILFPEDLVSFAKSLIATSLFSSNFYFWSERGYFGSAAELKPLIHTWSLAIEEQFYIVFPIFLLLLKRYVRLFYSLLILSFLLSIGSSYYVTLLHFDTAFYFPLTRAWEILFGSFAAFILKYKGFSIESWVADLTSLLGLSLIFYTLFEFDSETLFPYINALIPVLGTFLFIVTSQHSSLVKKALSTKIIVYTGLISFSLYLWHLPIFALARHLDLFSGNLIFLIVTIFLLSILTYILVEKPFRNRSVISLKTIVIFSLTGTLILIILGVFTLSSNGFPNRYKAEDRELLTQLANNKGYNQKKFDALQFKQFEDDSKYKVVIVGDSFAKDFLNIILESGKFNDYEFSTRQVNSECGNLYLKNYNSIEEYIPYNRRERCRVLGRYEGENFLKILNDTDEIWILGVWRDWVIELLPESIAKLDDKFEKPVRVFGIKDFGEILPYSLLGVPYDERVNYVQSVSESSLEATLRLRDKMKDYPYYYPLLDLLCGGSTSECRVFTSKGLLMSSDGGHLTKEGAIESALRFSETLIDIRNSTRQ